ncbi:MAG: HDIG domain-containing protein [Chloroflexota bacterium]|nr:HDIG domain-containing protein [Chloroflexota bacterium]MDQ5866889.1 HDIG domain-containing protein [Chloroflexota bacterium]
MTDTTLSLNGKTREDAWELVQQHVQNDGLRKHMLAVEAAMRAYAREYGADEEYWGTLGLIHDWDWEIHPTAEEHPSKGVEMLLEMGWPQELTRSILSHATYSGVPRTEPQDKALFACDELCGLVMATAMVKPNKSLAEVDARSVLKKMKDKAFARAVNRDDIRQGAEELGRPLDEHVDFVVRALQNVSTSLGL